jgi:ubiquinone/menaquinone biosynthesis C-methylase UbiE
MNQTSLSKPSQASLEALIESYDIGIESLHPGGATLSLELAERCHIGRGSKVMDVASGTGATACLIADQFGCCVLGIDSSPVMLGRARKKASKCGLAIEFRLGDAHALPADNGSYDVVICECTMCAFDKLAVLKEMYRVLKPGGYAGINDLCWQEDAPARLKAELFELENERPETLAGWKQCFEQAGFQHVVADDRSALFRLSLEQFNRQVGFLRRLKLLSAVVRKWGLRGLIRVLRSVRTFRSPFLGYASVVGQK